MVARPHGLHGELRVRLFNVESEVLLTCRRVRLKARVRRVLGARRERESILLRVAGCADRESAETLRGAPVEVAHEDLPVPGTDEYYFHDLIGLCARGPDGVDVGKVVDVVETAAHATLVVGDGPRRLEVPFAEPFVASVDLAGRTIRLEGLVELPGWDEFRGASSR